MFVDITIENFRSIKNPQTLTFDSIIDRRLRSDHLIEVDERTSLLKYCSVIGPNGAGKSTVIRALEMLQAMIVSQEDKPLHRLAGAAFAYDVACKRSPSTIQVQIIQGEDEESGLPVYYTYTLSADAVRVHRESLYRRVGRATNRMFDRELISLDKEPVYRYSYGKKYVGVRKRFSNKLAPNQLFIGGAARKGSESLLPFYQWVSDALVVIPIGLSSVSEQFLIDFMKRYPSMKDGVLEFLHTMDFNDVKELNVIEREGEKDRLVYVHGVSRSRYASYFSSESLGTRRITMMAAVSWLARQRSLFLVSDDFGLLLHDTVLEELYQKFTHETRLSKSQLLTTGVDLTPMNKGQHRYDEIWLTTKDVEGGTRFFSLADFVIRKDDSVKEMYLNGAFGAVPILSECIRRNRKEGS